MAWLAPNKYVKKYNFFDQNNNFVQGTVHIKNNLSFWFTIFTPVGLRKQILKFVYKKKKKKKSLKEIYELQFPITYLVF